MEKDCATNFSMRLNIETIRTVSFSQASELVPWLVAQIEGLLRNF